MGKPSKEGKAAAKNKVRMEDLFVKKYESKGTLIVVKPLTSLTVFNSSQECELCTFLHAWSSRTAVKKVSTHNVVMVTVAIVAVLSYIVDFSRSQFRSRAMVWAFSVNKALGDSLKLSLSLV